MLELPLLGQVHTKPDIFETAYFLSGFLWTGLFNPSGEEFQDKRVRWADSLVSCGRKVDSCFKVCGSKNIRIRVNVAFKIQPFTLFLVLKSDIFLRTTNNYFDFYWPHKAIKCLMVLCFLITDQATEKRRANSRRGRHSDSTYFVTSKYYSLLQECQIFICYWYCCCCI